MTVSSMAVLSRQYQNITDLGAKAVQSDGMIVFTGFEDMRLKTKQFPWPVATTGEPIETFGPLGMKMVQPSQTKIQQEGPIGIYESKDGATGEFLKALIAAGGKLPAVVYRGTVDDYTKKEELVDCILTMEIPDMDWENNTQAVVYQGTIAYHWFDNQ